MIVVFVALLSLLASAVATISGFGLATIMVPSLLFFMPFAQTMMLVGIIHLVNNTWRVGLFYTHINLTLFFYFGIPSIVAAMVGALVIPSNGSAYLFPLLGLFLISYVIFLFYVPNFQIKPTLHSALLGGGISGFTAGLFGIKGPIKGAFLLAYHLPKKQYIATISVIGLITDAVRVAIYMVRGFELSSAMRMGLFIFIPATIAGVYSARYIIRCIPQEYFRYVVSLFLLVVGIKFVVVDGIWKHGLAARKTFISASQ